MTLRDLSLAALCLFALACDDHKNARPKRTASVAGAADTAVGASQGVVVPVTIAASEYVNHVLAEQVGGFPNIGWLVPPHFLIVDGAPADVNMLDKAGSARFSSALPMTKAEEDSIRRKHFVACESDTASLFQTDFDVDKPRRVLVSSKPFPDAVVAKVEHPALSAAQLATGRALLTLSDSVQWHDSTFAMSASGAYYAVHAAYSRLTGRLVRSVLYYVNASGVIVAKRESLGEDFAKCEGCGIPHTSEGFARIFDVQNLFRLPGFPYPVLLVNTFTKQERILSLVTVTPDGQFSEGQASEPLARCVLKALSP